MGYPKTAEEWWELLVLNHDALRSIVVNYHPASYDSWQEQEADISAPLAERACSIVRDAVRKEQTPPQSHQDEPGARFDAAVRSKDGDALLSLPSAAWFGLPESMGSRDVEGFHALCDLCSEGWVLEPDNEGE